MIACPSLLTPAPALATQRTHRRQTGAAHHARESWWASRRAFSLRTSMVRRQMTLDVASTGTLPPTVSCPVADVPTAPTSNLPWRGRLERHQGDSEPVAPGTRGVPNEYRSLRAGCYMLDNAGSPRSSPMLIRPYSGSAKEEELCRCVHAAVLREAQLILNNSTISFVHADGPDLNDPSVVLHTCSRRAELCFVLSK